MKSSTEIDKLAGALAKAQAAFSTADKNKVNPAFGKSGFKYADLGSVIEAYRVPLATNGLALVQLTQAAQENWVTVETVLLHESGQWIAAELSLPAPKGTPQDFGAALTYCRRYGASTLLNIAADDDDDGNSATAAVVQRSVPRPTSQGSPQGDVARIRPAPSAPPTSPPVESFESLKRALGDTVAGPEGRTARLTISKRVIAAQQAGQVSAEQVDYLRGEYERLEKGGQA